MTITGQSNFPATAVIYDEINALVLWILIRNIFPVCCSSLRVPKYFYLRNLIISTNVLGPPIYKRDLN
jgi:hypothetical protein